MAEFPAFSRSSLVSCSRILVITLLFLRVACGQSITDEVMHLVEAACLDCHSSGTETSLNFETLGDDLSDADTLRRWVQVFDRVSSGEMPPESEPRPDAAELRTALLSLKQNLHVGSLLKQEKVGRVPARRLTKLEYGYTLQDLLHIRGDLTGNLPDEVDSGSFDTVGETQRLSAVHMEGYLRAAELALDRAIRLEENPYREYELDFINSAFLNDFHDKPLNLGGNISRKAENGVALFRDVDYLLTSFAGGFSVTARGLYRISTDVAAYQSSKPITLKIIRKEAGGGAELLATRDLIPGQEQSVVATTWLNPGDTFYTTFHMPAEPFVAISAAGGVQNYKGPGILLRGQQVNGPLTDSWPPLSTRQLLTGMEIRSAGGSVTGPFEIETHGSAVDHVAEIVHGIAPRLFRRRPNPEELDSFLPLAESAVAADRDFLDVVRIPLRAMLTSPQFLMFDGEPGSLDDHALANRLSYFLWKSLPDDELFRLADQGQLHDEAVLAGQVERMLEDARSRRFVRDFLGQWLRLYRINATTPDEKLYPEYDELLGNALTTETELFFEEFIANNLSLTNLIDSDFTFVNRRLAEHYGLTGVTGQHFRRVELPEDSRRGGVLTQAAVLKTTANGTVTSPVTRGNFVLTNLLGTPPSPPPPGVGSIEPDIRGKTTIREILAAHRDNQSCSKCHSEIDPPGFALECFDPIGGFRTRYRTPSEGPGLFAIFGSPSTYSHGPSVDSSGVTADGREFSGIMEFRQFLMRNRDQVARNLVSQLVVYSTGGQIEFADRDDIEAILDRTREHDFPLRDVIHEVVTSRMFRQQ